MIHGPQRRKNESDRFLVGDQYANNNPFLMSIAIIWHKYHNLLASEMHEADPSLSDEQIYSSIKKRIVAHLQKITIYDWLPSFVPLDRVSFLTIGNDPTQEAMLPPYTGHDANVNPGLKLEFSMAMRAAHSMVPRGIVMRQKKGIISILIKSVKLLFNRKLVMIILIKGTALRKWHLLG